MYSIRKAAAEDHSSIVRLHTEAFYGGVKEVPSLDKGWWWVCEFGGEPIAFCGMHPSTQYTDAVYLCRVAISPEHQGTGLHKRLIRVRENFARSSGMLWVVTDTYYLNLASSNSLIRAGYKLWQPKRGHSWATYRNALYWWKRL